MMIFKKNSLSLCLAFALLVVFLFPQGAWANAMHSMEIQVRLHEDGSGHVTEIRDMSLQENTEIYIPMNPIDQSQVLNFRVSEQGVNFQDVGAWNVDRSREEKAGQYGRVDLPNGGVELCWGIGDYGRHTYVVEYDITNMVRQLQDGQSFFWKLFNEGTDMPPQSLTVVVEGPQPFLPENTKIWGFGFPGEITFDNGRIKAVASEPLQARHKVIVLSQFLDQPFAAQVPLDMTLADQETMAKEGSSYQDGKDSGGQDSSIPWGLVKMVFDLFFYVSIIIVGFLGFRIFRGSGSKGKKEIISRNKDLYYRDIPYAEGPFTDVVYFLRQMGAGDLQECFNAYFLKWIKEGHLSHVKDETGFLFKREASVLQLHRGQVEGNQAEARLWNMLCSAAGPDNRLEEREFTKWAKKKYTRIEDWEDDLKKRSELQMDYQGYLQGEEKKILGLIPITTYHETEKGKALQDRLVQFKNYLKDFSLLGERGPDQVGLWEDMLIWASLYGIADQVAKDLEKLHPEIFQEGNFTYADIYVMHHFSESFYSGYDSGRSASSGGGGSTSIGGGGGSFGGGSGGGSR